MCVLLVYVLVLQTSRLRRLERLALVVLVYRYIVHSQSHRVVHSCISIEMIRCEMRGYKIKIKITISQYRTVGLGVDTVF